MRPVIRSFLVFFVFFLPGAALAPLLAPLPALLQEQEKEQAASAAPQQRLAPRRQPTPRAPFRKKKKKLIDDDERDSLLSAKKKMLSFTPREPLIPFSCHQDQREKRGDGARRGLRGQRERRSFGKKRREEELYTEREFFFR